jgi:hypothetical protein
LRRRSRSPGDHRNTNEVAQGKHDVSINIGGIKHAVGETGIAALECAAVRQGSATPPTRYAARSTDSWSKSGRPEPFSVSIESKRALDF